MQAQAANDRLKEQTAVGVWAPGWQPGTPKQDLGVSVPWWSAKGLRTAGKCGRDPAQDVDSALCLGIAQLWPDKMPYLSSLQLHTSLLKAQSSILTQVRTGKIGLAAFLCKRRVPSFPTPACSCGAQWETARHVVVACPRLLRARYSLHAAAATTDYQVMTS